ncbi:MAG TPA: type II secretion system F family protein [Chroococcales cyanobacterium]
MGGIVFFLLIAVAVFASALLLVLLFGGRLLEKFEFSLESYREKTKESLRKSGNPLSTERFARFQQILTGISALLGLGLGESLVARVFLALLFGACAWLACDRYLGSLWSRYLKDLEEQLPDMVATVANAVKSGFSIQQALEAVISEFTPPMSEEMGGLVQELRMGVPLDKALSNWSNRIRLDDLDIFCTALIIQRQTGGNLAEVLGNLGNTMRERRKIQGQIRTLTAQGRTSGSILALLPVILFVVLYLLSPERQGLLLSRPAGWGMIALSAGMIGFGSFIISKIVTIDI